ncbi:cation:proton antiporter [Rubrivirga marina]|uniref:Cation/H(+) antiporter n=1 Tax=Rubrivirga marina TaxID=1196024 RepID=A0A271J0W9_9BACT|nr:cation:proton antiporter [Rubrivirga marina]PAP77103.1 hypothetical protein BSZ37_12035 [Rubrivirga marina]
MLLYLLPQIAAILVLGRILGGLAHRVGQPRVVGEMAAGIVLGPSLLGWLAPAAQAALFPAESLGALNAIAQVGLVLFLFLVGLELDPAKLRGQGHAALVTSHASIIAPFLLGSVLALYLYPQLSDASVQFSHFALFMGAAMSVTAFPVLARILAERNLLQTKLGVVAITCAAVDDVTAWGLLAVVIALVRTSGAVEVVAVFAWTIVFVALVLFALRPALRRLAVYHRTRGGLTRGALATVLLVTIASAWTTEWIGIHALFGAFLAGVAMPKDPDFVRDVEHRLSDVTTLLFLPLFFAYAGLNTQIGLLDSPRLWLDAGLVVAVATAGKFGGSALAARMSGLGMRESAALGILMNTRGLMELVILTIGLELGVVSPALFAMMVIMALATTVMTTPVLERIYPASLAQQESADAAPSAFSVLLPVALPSNGPELLRVARALAPASRLRVYPLHLLRADRPLADALAPLPADETDALLPLLAAADGLDIRPLAFVSRDVGGDVVDLAKAKQADLVLMGWHEPVVARSALGGVVRDVMRRAPTEVAVVLSRGDGAWGRVLVPFAGGPHDRAALALARRLAEGPEAVPVTVLTAGLDARDAVSVAAVEAARAAGLDIRPALPGAPLDAVVAEAASGYGLVVAGASAAWGLEPSLFSVAHERLAREVPASLLVVRAGPEQGAG